jgi:hypothetical protein
VPSSVPAHVGTCPATKGINVFPNTLSDMAVASGHRHNRYTNIAGFVKGAQVLEIGKPGG